ncbi:MAG: hypothetical protein JSU66_08995 [Deltaproteobacteria bacterium]|nr:MAG: hypothetical protein JSU66_08995 [Deltaproteobacteria bacterium]
MIEALITLALVAALCVGCLAPLHWIAAAGALGIVVGLLIGIPTGFGYHVALGRVLGARGDLPERWWMRPTALHDALEPHELERIMPWFYVGGAGFALTIAGCVAFALAALRAAAA